MATKVHVRETPDRMPGQRGNGPVADAVGVMAVKEDSARGAGPEAIRRRGAEETWERERQARQMTAQLKQAVRELEQVDILEDLPPARLLALAQEASVREFGAKEAIYSPGEDEDEVLLIAEGKAKVHQVANSGREFVLTILQPSDTFGILREGSEGRAEVYVTAVEPGRLYALPRARFEQLMREHPEVALRVLGKLNERLRRAEEQIEDFAFRNVPTRVARLLARLGEDYGTVSRSGITIGLRLSHQDIANMLATSRETVSGVLGDLREAGLIRTGGRTISILNYSGLQEAGNPN